MSYAIHKTFGRNLKQGLMGYQFNYPMDGAVFDIERQRYRIFKEGLSDKKLKDYFISMMQDSSEYWEKWWKDIKEITKPL